MIDPRVEDVIRAVGRETDAPPEAVEAVIRGALPSIRLEPQFPKEGQLSPLGGSRIGGLPDLPAGVNWPRLSAALRRDPWELSGRNEPLWFLMQINLAEVAAADGGGLLPNAGILYFFFHWSIATEPDDDAGFVLFYEGDMTALRRAEAPPDLRPAGQFRGFDLTPRLEWAVPKCDDTNFELGFWNNLDQRVAEAQGLEDGWGAAPVHRMLGHPELLQAPGLGEGAILLLQLDSGRPAGFGDGRDYPDTGMRWGDLGRIYFVISDDNLKARDFRNVLAVLEDQ